MHFCKGKIADVSVFGKAKSCKMLVKKVDANSILCKADLNQHKDDFKKAKCCYNETIAVDVTDELTSADNTTLNHSQLTFITAYFISSYHLFVSEEKETEHFDYSPPLISKDIQVLDQVFII